MTQLFSKSSEELAKVYTTYLEKLKKSYAVVLPWDEPEDGVEEAEDGKKATEDGDAEDGDAEDGGEAEDGDAEDGVEAAAESGGEKK